MKTVDEIFGEMLVCFGERTGMEVDQGCDLAVRLYAAAAQIYAMYLQADWVARQAFPQTAEGDYLDLHAQLRGLERKQASHALLCGPGGRDAQGDPLGHRMYDRGLGAVRDHAGGCPPGGTAPGGRPRPGSAGGQRRERSRRNGALHGSGAGGHPAL